MVPGFRLPLFPVIKEKSLEILISVVDQFYLQVSNGDMDLLLKPKRALENIATKEIVKYFREERNEILELFL